MSMMKDDYQRTINRKFVAGYVITCSVCLLFSLVIDARFGVTFLCFLIALPILSLFFCSLALKNSAVTLEATQAVLSKGDTFTIDIRITQHGGLALALLRIALYDSVHLSGNGKQQDIVYPLFRRDTETISLTYAAAIGGSTRIGLQRIRIGDLLGFVQYQRDFTLTDDRHNQTVAVLPHIPSLVENDLLREVIAAGLLDDTEEENERHSHGNGLPGYEHRPYQPGDSLKRINWKLSAKRDSYMVRLDEAAARRQQNIVIDYFVDADEATREERYANALRRERLLEAVLALANYLVGQEIDCHLHYLLRESWQSMTVKDQADVATLQSALAAYSFGDRRAGLSRLPRKLADNVRFVLFFTDAPDNQSDIPWANLQQAGRRLQLVTAQKEKPAEAWYVDETYALIL